MSASLSDEEVIRTVQIIRSANVRDESYRQAEGFIIGRGKAARPIVMSLLSDPEKVVRERATELLQRLA